MASTRRRGAVLENAILEAAWSELTEKGYAALTFEAIAERAGTSKHVIYRRWPTREEVLVAALAHRGVMKPVEPEDTGSLRGDIVALLTRINGNWDDLAGVLSSLIGAYFQESKTTLADLRTMAFGDRPPAMRQIIDRARGRGELAVDIEIPIRILTLPIDLLRHELLLALRPVSDEAIIDIVDTVVLPLIGSYEG